MKEITLETKVSELLNDYEGMKDILISINPKFKKLNNPVLRRTLAKLASVRQAAFVGGMDQIDLLNKLRVAVGQKPVDENSVKEAVHDETEAPSWIETEPKAVFDANKLLDDGKNPLAEVNIALKSLQKDEVIMIKSDFMPEPLIEEFRKKGHIVFCKKIDDDNFETFIKSSD